MSETDHAEIEIINYSDGDFYGRDNSAYSGGIARATRMPHFTEAEQAAARPKFEEALARSRADQAHLKHSGLLRRFGIGIEDSDV